MSGRAGTAAGAAPLRRAVRLGLCCGSPAGCGGALVPARPGWGSGGAGPGRAAGQGLAGAEAGAGERGAGRAVELERPARACAACPPRRRGLLRGAGPTGLRVGAALRLHLAAAAAGGLGLTPQGSAGRSAERCPDVSLAKGLHRTGRVGRVPFSA